MFDLLDVTLLMLLVAGLAWFWHGHGIREQALMLAKRHCTRMDIELLDGNVAFRRFAILHDGKGFRRLARLYDFEFTVTGEQRLKGTISMFGRHFAGIELAPHPILDETPTEEPVATQHSSANVVRLSDWKAQHSPRHKRH